MKGEGLGFSHCSAHKNRICKNGFEVNGGCLNSGIQLCGCLYPIPNCLNEDKTPYKNGEEIEPQPKHY